MPRLDLKRAAYLQVRLSRLVEARDNFRYPPKLIGGVDVAYRRGVAIGVAVVLDYESLEEVEHRKYAIKVDVPYIPTFLAFREIPAMVGALNSLENRPDIVLVDSHGLMHPRGLGAASHLGVVMEMPTIGVAKSPLVGRVRGDNFIEYRGRIVGYMMNRNLYISVGHRVSLRTAIRIVGRVTRGTIPEPTRLAHNYSSIYKSRM